MRKLMWKSVELLGIGNEVVLIGKKKKKVLVTPNFTWKLKGNQ